MASVWLSRYSRWLEALNNAKGGAVLLDIDPALKATAQIMEGNEDRYLQGWNRYGIRQGITGGAAQTAGVQLHNPTNSNVVAVVEKLQVNINPAGATVSNFNLSITPGPATIAELTTVTQAQNLDGRQKSNSSVIFSSTVNATSFAYSMAYCVVGSTTNYDFIGTVDQEIVLLPASAIMIVDLTAAELAQFTLTWRERPLQQSELT